MPIYEYQCANCHHQFELMQKVNDAPAKQCPKCFEQTATKLVSAAGFQLKGTGWYVTDFKNKGTQKDSTSADKTHSEDASKKTDDNKKTESKPESKKTEGKKD